VAFANRETPWLSLDVISAGTAVTFNPDVSVDLCGYLISYEYTFRPADLKMSTMQAVQGSFRRAVGDASNAAYTAALTQARLSSAFASNALHSVAALNITGTTTVGNALHAKPAAATAVSSVASLLASALSAQVALGAVAGASVVYAAGVYFLRSGLQQSKGGEEALVSFTHVEFFFSICVSITAAASNMLQIRTALASPGSLGVAAVMIVSRVAVAVYAAVLLALTLTRPSLHKLLAATALASKGILWVLVALVSLLDPTHLRFFPWKQSEFAERSRGFPTLQFFKLAMGCTAFNALVQLSVSAAKGLSFSAIASLSLSLILFVSTVFTIVVKLVAEKIYQHDLSQHSEPSSMESAIRQLAERDAKIAALEAENAQLRRSASGGPGTSSSDMSLVPFFASKRLSVTVDLDAVYNPASASVGAAASASGERAVLSANKSELELAAFRDSVPKP
jgi:hypothetical protein